MTKKRKRVERPFPRVTLEKALRIPTAIKGKNAGNPWPPEEIAKALKVGAKTGSFYYFTAGARDYHLTEGSSKTEKISLTALGRRVLYPASPEEEIVAKREAFLSVDKFRQVLEYYRGSDLPEEQYLGNTLQTEMGLDPDVHTEFVELFLANCKFLGIGHKVETSALLPARPAATTAVVRESDTKLVHPSGDLLCFVIMPFVERQSEHPPGFFEEVFSSLIAPAAQQAGFEVRTANRQGSDVIQSTIVNDLLQADLVVADLTEHNPNVLFELGMRMCEDKPVALIKATGTGRIFDVDNMLRVYEYDSCLWPSTVETDRPSIAEHIKSAWDSRETGISYMKLLRQAPLATLDSNRNF